MSIATVPLRLHLMPRIPFIHATEAAVAPVVEAFRADRSEAVTVNLLDDSLASDQARDGGSTPAAFAHRGVGARGSLT